MSDQKFNDVRNSAQPFTICNMFDQFCDLMVATMLARANIRFSFEKDDIVTSNLGMEFESHFKLISLVNGLSIFRIFYGLLFYISGIGFLAYAFVNNGDEQKLNIIVYLPQLYSLSSFRGLTLGTPSQDSTSLQISRFVSSKGP